MRLNEATFCSGRVGRIGRGESLPVPRWGGHCRTDARGVVSRTPPGDRVMVAAMQAAGMSAVAVARPIVSGGGPVPGPATQ